MHGASQGCVYSPLTSIWFALLRTSTVFFLLSCLFVCLPPPFPPFLPRVCRSQGVNPNSTIVCGDPSWAGVSCGGGSCACWELMTGESSESCGHYCLVTSVSVGDVPVDASGVPLPPTDTVAEGDLYGLCAVAIDGLRPVLMKSFFCLTALSGVLAAGAVAMLMGHDHMWQRRPGVRDSNPFHVVRTGGATTGRTFRADRNALKMSSNPVAAA